jgi:hypothetical protein
MIKKIALYMAMSTICISLTAQSIFTFYGPPDFTFTRDTYGEGMGGTGAGDLFRVNTSFVNPAISTSIGRTYFTTAVSMGTVTYSDQNQNSFSDNHFSIPYFNIVFPYKQSRFGFHYQNISASILNTQAQATIFDGDIPLIEEQKIETSMFRAGLFWANRNQVLNFGVGLNYIFGHDIRFSQQDFDDPSLVNSRFEVEKQFRNPSATVGVAKNFGKVSSGLAGSLPLSLKGESYFRGNSLDMDEEEQAVYELPAHINFGLTYKLTNLVFLSTDIDYDMWGQTANFDDPKDTIRLGLGVAWAGMPMSKKFLAKFPARAGISYRNLPFEVNNNSINEVAYHFGLSLPLKQYDSYLDIATKFYSRGNAKNTLYEENGFTLTFGIHGFDFIRTPPNRKVHRDIPRTDAQRGAQRERGGEGGRPQQTETES